MLLILLRSLNVLRNMILGAFVSYNIHTTCMNLSCIVRMYTILSACLTCVYASVRKKHAHTCIYVYINTYMHVFDLCKQLYTAAYIRKFVCVCVGLYTNTHTCFTRTPA